jgi:hypothetical protein
MTSAPRHLPRNIHQGHHGGIPQPPGILLTPAFMAFPFLRSPIGYDLAFPVRAIGSVLFVSIVPLIYWFFWLGLTERPMPQNCGHWWLVGYAVSSWCVQCCIFGKRWTGQQRGEEVHTHEGGYSALSWHTRLPAPLCEQVLLPLGIAALGYAVKESVSLELGWWLILTGASYAIMSNWEWRMRWAQVREPVNQMIRASVFEERLGEHERAARTPRARPDAAPGRASGVESDPDMAELGSAKRSSYAPADPPDAAGFRQGSDNTAPDFMTFFRPRRRS